jgi:hypothetical protein
VLCLAGLTIYLVVKQFMHPDTLSKTMRPVRPEAQQIGPGSSRPQTTPHIEVLKPDKIYVDAKDSM